MPLQKLQFRPGVNREGTNYSNEGGWYECDKIRFRSGYPEKIGGWTRATGSYTYEGVCRMMINWVDLSSNNLVGVGTHVKYYINNGLGEYHNITPIRLERTVGTALSSPFDTTSGSNIITVNDTANGAQLGDFVTFSGSTSVGGIPASEINAEHQITNIVNANTYQITVTTSATSTVTGGGTVDAIYQINIGLPVYTIGNGFGAGVWNGPNTSLSTSLAYTSGSGNVLLNALSTTINVDDTTGFAASGAILIDSEYITYSGKTSTSFTGCVRGVQHDVTYASTTISASINDSVTTIPLTSVTGFTEPQFDSAGIVKIGTELISYTAVDSGTSSLTGCVRGVNGTTAASHTSGDTIAEYAGVEHALDPTTGSATPPDITVYQVTSFLGTTGWGEASDISFGTGIGQQMRLWTNDTYGQDLLIAPRGGPIYYWADNTATFPAATELVTDVPIVATNQIVVSDVARFVIAMGCNAYGDLTETFDPLLVRWSDQEDPNAWDPTVTGTQAGEQRLTNGSYIMQAKKTRQEILIWTDAAIYSMQFLGPPYTWGFQLLMDNLSIMSPNSAIVVNNVAYWMGTDKFYSYSGRVETLPCSLRQYVYTDMNFSQRFQVVCGSNEGYNEIWWYYVSNAEVAAAAEDNRDPTIDKYVVYNHLERTWHYGSMRRTYWLDTPLQSNPLAAQGLLVGATNSDANHISISAGTMVFHEFGNDDASTESPVSFNAYIQSSDFDIGDGHNLGFVWRIIPDLTFSGSNSGYPQVTMQIKPRYYSGSPYGTADDPTVTSAQQYSQLVKSYTVEQYTPQVYTRLRGRQMAFRIESDGQLGVAWQLGSPRMDIRPDGRR